jgi:hypothetical protein
LAADAAGTKPARTPIRGILYNEDDSHRFVLDPPGAMKPERLDQLVDELADSQVTAMLICCNAKKTNFPSKSWEPHSQGFDPAKGDDQPYFGDVPKEDREGNRRWAQNLKLMLDSGIDPMQRMIDRCRARRISPWVSIRMNDVHDAHLLRSPLHSRLWLAHHEYWRYPDRFRAWTDRCFDYGRKPVRDNMMALVREVCQRYDVDGLELDWNRFPAHFREGIPDRHLLQGDTHPVGGVPSQMLVRDEQPFFAAGQRPFHHLARVGRRADCSAVSPHKSLDGGGGVDISNRDNLRLGASA